MKYRGKLLEFVTNYFLRLRTWSWIKRKQNERKGKRVRNSKVEQIVRNHQSVRMHIWYVYMYSSNKNK